MGRPNYVCTICEEHFTRMYSATRHNITIHSSRGEIVSLLEYIVGLSSGRYRASHPFWYRRRSKEKRIQNLEATTLADSMGNAFRPVGLQRQEQEQYQYQYDQQSLEEQERYHRPQQEQSLSASIPPSPAAIQDQPRHVLPYPTD
jgi:hypothetical protein